MDDVSKRLAALAPEQLRLLELRLKQQGLSQPSPAPAAASAAGVLVFRRRGRRVARAC